MKQNAKHKKIEFKVGKKTKPPCPLYQCPFAPPSCAQQNATPHSCVLGDKVLHNIKATMPKAYVGWMDKGPTLWVIWSTLPMQNGEIK